MLRSEVEEGLQGEWCERTSPAAAQGLAVHARGDDGGGWSADRAGAATGSLGPPSTSVADRQARRRSGTRAGAQAGVKPAHSVATPLGSGGTIHTSQTPRLRRTDLPRSQHDVLASMRPLPAGSEHADPGAPLSAPLQGREGELAQLVARISRDDQEALATLYEATYAVVYGQAVRLLGDPAAAEDITMEVYTQLQHLASTYEPSRGVPSAWLLMLTRSRAIDYRRAQAARQRREVPLQMAVDLPSPELDPQAWSAAAEWRCHVQAALTALNPAQREVIDSAYYGGLSHREIAVRLGQPLGTVKTRLRTGMRVLRDALRPLGV